MVTRGGGGSRQTVTNGDKGGGGSKIGIFTVTYFLNGPKVQKGGKTILDAA